METSTDDFELKKSMMSSQIRTLRDVMEGQFRRTLTQLVETHENDRKGNFNRFLIRASLNHSADVFRQLESSIRDEFPKYISALNYFQGGSVSIRFTNDPPPGGWEPMLVDMDQIFGPVDSPVTDVPNDLIFEDGCFLREWTNPTIKQASADEPQRLLTPKRVGGFIKTSVATRKIPDNPSWAFSYDLGEGLRYFILECPIRGCQVSFSTNPLKNKLAATHFEQCNVPFSDEEDIVRRFARQCESTSATYAQDLNEVTCAQTSPKNFAHTHNPLYQYSLSERTMRPRKSLRPGLTTTTGKCRVRERNTTA
ncbi:hypothetical protein CSUB01_08108 [Colletotrichum sublineola]|uniref:Uncharacterized protein n=1 Tax=Colletotrichum sublineola TaxID=1173701 RepID=A0A066X592_COLSU|nr:hypothetical protein CSUB01_08108 [Colletotrichum sublineola]